jgi:hypothetical protein
MLCGSVRTEIAWEQAVIAEDFPKEKVIFYDRFVDFCFSQELPHAVQCTGTIHPILLLRLWNGRAKGSHCCMNLACGATTTG